MRTPLRVLLLEDDPNDARLVQEALARSGLPCDVRVTADRAEYIAALEDTDFDLVLSDSGVPGFSGTRALRRAREAHPGIAFVFVSGHGEPAPGEPRSDQTSEDDVEFVPKTDLGALRQAVEQALEGAARTTPSSGPSRDFEHPAERLVDAIQRLSLARDLPTVMAIVRRAARDLTGADGASFVLRERDLCYYADEDAIAPLWKGKRFPMSACISGWVMKNAKPAVIEDIFDDDRIPVDAYEPTFVKSLAMVPIREEDPVGAIGNYWARPHEASPADVRLLQALANSTAIAMENVELYNELEQRVRERTRQLEAANEELEAFSYSVSHDLRAPVRHIQGFGEMLVEDSVDRLSEAGLGHVTRIREAADRMNQIIEDLLALSRITREEIERETVDLSAMAGDVASELRASAPDRDVDLAIQDGLTAEGDPRLLRVLLENLLSNAWKYTSKEPRVRIVFGRTDEEDGRVVHYVRDNGAGFDMENAQELFAPFQRLHAEAEFPGVGVGLATVQRIVRRHGGRVWAEGVAGEGATFFFTLD